MIGVHTKAFKAEGFQQLQAVYTRVACARSIVTGYPIWFVFQKFLARKATSAKLGQCGSLKLAMNTIRWLVKGQGLRAFSV